MTDSVTIMLYASKLIMSLDIFRCVNPWLCMGTWREAWFLAWSLRSLGIPWHELSVHPRHERLSVLGMSCLYCVPVIPVSVTHISISSALPCLCFLLYSPPPPQHGTPFDLQTCCSFWQEWFFPNSTEWEITIGVTLVNFPQVAYQLFLYQVACLWSPLGFRTSLKQFPRLQYQSLV